MRDIIQNGRVDKSKIMFPKNQLMRQPNIQNQFLNNYQLSQKLTTLGKALGKKKVSAWR